MSVKYKRRSGYRLKSGYRLPEAATVCAGDLHIMQTIRLVDAAFKVWALKNGIDPVNWTKPVQHYGPKF